MSIVFTESADICATGDLVERWQVVGNGCAIAPGITGMTGNSLRISGSSLITKGLTNFEDTIIIGFRFSTQALGNNKICTLTRSGGEAISLWLNAEGKLNVLVPYSSGVNLYTSEPVISIGGVYYIEWKISPKNSGGFFDLRIDEHSYLSASNVDTTYGAVSGVDAVSFCNAAGGSGSTYYDDIVILNTVNSGVPGAPNNDFLGDVKVMRGALNADGTYRTWTPGTGASLIAMVDDAVPNDDNGNDFMSGTLGQQATFSVVDLGVANGTIFAVNILANAKKDDQGLREIAMMCRYGGGDFIGSSKALGDTYKYYSQIFESKPGGGAWDVIAFNQSEIGVKVTA